MSGDSIDCHERQRYVKKEQMHCLHLIEAVDTAVC